jgi:protein involved in polysaccharide export with SLBB domain
MRLLTESPLGRSLSVFLAAWIALPATGVGTARAQVESDELQQTLTPGTPEEEERSTEEAARLGEIVLEKPVDPERYVLGPGDLLQVVILGGPSPSYHLPVLPEGSVFVPQVGPVRAAGKTLARFREDLREALRRRYRNVEYHCLLEQVRSFVVYITGEVHQPGAVRARGVDRVSDLVRRAGGVTSLGSERSIQIRKGDSVVTRADLWAFRRFGDLERNPNLASGQNLYVPLLDRQVEVRGRVRKRGRFELCEGEELGALLEMVGGFLPGAERDNIRVERTDDQGRAHAFVTSADRDTFALRDHDVVIVPPGDLAEPSVFVEGEGHWAGRLAYHEGDRVSDLISKIGDLSQVADLDRVTIEREEEGGDSRILPVDLRALLEGDESADFPLEQGDALNVPVRSQVVYMAGQVRTPGPLPYHSDWPAERYIAMAGGPETASSFGSFEIISPNGERRGGDRAEVVYRGETIYLKTRTSKQILDIMVGLGTLTSLVLSIVALSRN